MKIINYSLIRNKPIPIKSKIVSERDCTRYVNAGWTIDYFFYYGQV